VVAERRPVVLVTGSARRYVRAAAERINQTVEFVCRRIADARGITFG
jgi:hypothetical protein